MIARENIEAGRIIIMLWKNYVRNIRTPKEGYKAIGITDRNYKKGEEVKIIRRGCVIVTKPTIVHTHILNNTNKP